MVYVALLRGINVGGKNKVEMSRVKATFENAGLTDVSTYINSGNVIFKSRSRKRVDVEAQLEAAIQADFGFSIKVFLRDLASIRRLLKALPDNWTNDSDMRCDVLFLGKEQDKPGVVKRLPIKPELVDVVYVPGAIILRMDRANVMKSGLSRLIGTDLYRGLTIRNCNTVRKLAELMEGA